MIRSAISEPLNQMFSSLKSRNYKYYFMGQSISLIGTWMQTVAMGWLVFRLTGSVFLLGVIGFTSQAPAFFFSPFAGVFTDRFNKRRIMLFTQILFLLQAIVLALLVLSGYIAVWHLIVLSLIFGFITVLDAPARQSMVIEMIDDPAKLGNAIALNSSIFNGARLLGPAIAGLVIAAAGEGICFVINALSYVAVITALLKMQLKPVPKPSFNTNFRKELTDGFRYTFGFKPIKVLLILLALVSFIGIPFSVLMPAFASETLRGGSHTLGFLMSASGAGALLAALYLAQRKTVIGLGKVISVNTLVFGLSIAVLFWSSFLWIALLAMFFSGFSMIATVASINTLIQTLADEDKRGRVMSFYSMALMGMNPLGSFVAGSMAGGIGIQWTLLIYGSLTVLVGLWFELERPTLRKHTVPVYLKKGIILE